MPTLHSHTHLQFTQADILTKFLIELAKPTQKKN